MTARHDLDRRLTDFYAAEAPPRAPDWVLGQVLATVDTTPQRRGYVRLPRRIHDMNSYAKLAIAAVVVIAVGLVGLTFLRPGSGPSVGGPNPSASPSPSATPNPSAPPPLTETFTSTLHGISISYPTGWATQAATDLSPSAEEGFGNPGGDWIYDREFRDHLFLALGSEPLAGAAGEAWAEEYAIDPVLGCEGNPTRAITVDGSEGLRCENLVMVWVADRGYEIRLHISDDDPWVAELYDQAWFDTVLATVQLNPEDAAAPSASP